MTLSLEHDKVKNRKFAYVAIGGSWGGTAALIKVLEAIPFNFSAS